MLDALGEIVCVRRMKCVDRLPPLQTFPRSRRLVPGPLWDREFHGSWVWVLLFCSYFRPLLVIFLLMRFRYCLLASAPQIPDQPWFLWSCFTITVGGILPYGAVFIEMFFILQSLWMGNYYYVFGFLMLVFIILIVTCADIAMVFCYFQLCAEDYHW